MLNPWLAQYRMDMLEAARAASSDSSDLRDELENYRQQVAALRKQLVNDDDNAKANAALKAAVAEEQRRIEKIQAQLVVARSEAADDLEEARERLDEETKWLAKARQALSILRLEEGARVSEEEDLKQDLSEETDKLREATAEIARLAGVLSRLQAREADLTS